VSVHLNYFAGELRHLPTNPEWRHVAGLSINPS
jgi:hypothetical protein